MSVADQVNKHHSTVFRRLSVKRRSEATGLFETDWLDITKDVKKWGTYKVAIDAERINKFAFSSANIVMANDLGLYNPEDDEASLWYGYLSQQRTLVKVEAGFLQQYQSADGIWRNYEVPADSNWDEVPWDGDSAIWDNGQPSTIFTGIISGDLGLSSKNEVAFPVRPLTQVFIDYAARNLTGWTSTGCTASQFMGMLRDQTDGSGAFVFRPFFGDTTSMWDISTTSVVYGNLNTSTAKQVVNSNVWQIIEKLSESENFVPFVTKEGMFRFISRSANTSTVAFEFFGGGSRSPTYGNTIKSIERFGNKISKYYSRVQVHWLDSDSASSYEVQQSALVVEGANNPWNLGARSLEIENFLIPTSTVAATIALNVFNDVSALKNEIAFTTSFIPQLEILDRVAISYDTPPSNINTLWDQNNWADDNTDTSADLTWDRQTGDAIRLAGDEFKFLSISINLDKLENKFEAREI